MTNKSTAEAEKGPTWKKRLLRNSVIGAALPVAVLGAIVIGMPGSFLVGLIGALVSGIFGGLYWVLGTFGPFGVTATGIYLMKRILHDADILKSTRLLDLICGLIGGICIQMASSYLNIVFLDNFERDAGEVNHGMMFVLLGGIFAATWVAFLRHQKTVAAKADGTDAPLKFALFVTGVVYAFSVALILILPQIYHHSSETRVTRLIEQTELQMAFANTDLNSPEAGVAEAIILDAIRKDARMNAPERARMISRQWLVIDGPAAPNLSPEPGRVVIDVPMDDYAVVCARDEFGRVAAHLSNYTRSATSELTRKIIDRLCRIRLPG